MLKKSLGKQVLSLLVCCLLMLGTVSYSFAAENNDATLSSLGFEDLILLDFDKNDLDYEVVFPYNKEANGYYVPKVVATATDPNATVLVSYPDDITCGAITIDVTAADGTTKLTYQITGTTVGGNLYSSATANFEGGSVGDWAVNGGGITLSATDQNPIQGEYSMKVSAGTNPSWFVNTWPETKVTEGKTYIGSVMVGLEETSTSNVSLSYYANVHSGGGSITRTYYNTSTWVVDSSFGTVTLKTTEPKHAFMLLKPSATCVPRHFFTTWGAQPALLLDDYFLGELAVAKVLVANEDGQTAEKISATSLTEPKTIQLSAKALNQYGNPAGLEAMTTVSEWRTVGTAISVSENGLVTIPANTPAGTYYVEALMDATATGQGTIKGVFKVSVAEGSLQSLEVSGPSVIEFDRNRLGYTVALPATHANGVDTFAMPTVTATPVDSSHTVSVTYPASVAENAEIAVTVKDADENIVDVYTLKLHLIGGNLYSNGNFENNSVTPWEGLGTTSLTISGQNPIQGDYSLKVSTGTQWYANGKAVENGKTYIAANKVCLETPETTATLDNWIAKVAGSKTYYNTETWVGGTSSSVNLTSNWQDTFVIYKPTASGVPYHYFTNWSTNPTLILDDYFLGELVVSNIGITNNDGSALGTMTRPASGTIALKASAVNQYGNPAGLENETVTWTVVNAPAGVTINNEGVLTVPDGFAGDIKVQAMMEPSYEGAEQDKVKGTATITIVADGICYYKGNAKLNAIASGTVESCLTLLDSVGESIDFMVALYEKDTTGTLKLVSVTDPISETISESVYEATQTVTVPSDGKTYVLKSFVWKQDTLQPVMPAEVLQ